MKEINLSGSDITLRSKEARIVNLIANAGFQRLSKNVDWFQELRNYINGFLVNSNSFDVVGTFIKVCERVGANEVKKEIIRQFKQKQR